MVQRRLADRLGITTLELNKRAETDKSIDDQIDSVFKNLAKAPKNLVVDSRMAFHFLPESFRIKLEVHPRVAATRIQGDTSRVGEGTYNSLEDIELAIVARKASERARFKTYYNADIEDHAGYSLIINTTDCDPQAVSLLAHEAISAWKRGGRPETSWLSPRVVFSNTDPETLNPSTVEKCRINWPIVASWPEGAIKVARADKAYMVVAGAEWLSAALKSGKGLMPVTLVPDLAAGPDPAMTEKWETSHKFRHIAEIYS
jgi:cytidylate kinase